jgi:hypothetical protein
VEITAEALTVRVPQFDYEPKTDTLAVQLSAEPIVDTIEPATGVLVSLDKDQRPVLIEFMGPVREWFAPLIDHFLAEAEQRTRRAG